MINEGEKVGSKQEFLENQPMFLDDFAVLFHKLPPQWEDEIKNKNLDIGDSNLPQNEICDDGFKKHFSQYDIYFNMMLHLMKISGINNLHVVFGFSESEQGNWEKLNDDGFLKIDNNITLWRISDIHCLNQFLDAKVYFMRGNYHRLYQRLLTKSRKGNLSIFYPATAQIFPSYSRFMKIFTANISENQDTKMLRTFLSQIFKSTGGKEFKKIHRASKQILEQERILISQVDDVKKLINSYVKVIESIRSQPCSTPYSIVLYDEPLNLPELKSNFKHSVLLRLKKPVSECFKFTNLGPRDIDFIFSATPHQKTKNHEIFMSFVRYLEKSKITSTVAFLGDTGQLPELTNTLSAKYDYVTVESPGYVDLESLVNYYNRSKISLIFSGRDCNPRVISESLMCGCYNVILDILSDGSTFIKDNPLLGRIVDCTDEVPIFSGGKSISISPSDKLFSQIASYRENDLNHFSIAMVAKEMISKHEPKLWQTINEYISHVDSITPKSI